MIRRLAALLTLLCVAVVLAPQPAQEQFIKKCIEGTECAGPAPYLNWNFATSLAPSGPGAVAGTTPTNSHLGTTETCFNQAGLLVAFSPNTVRRCYNPANGQPLGILSEGVTSNLQQNFGDPTQSGWALNGAASVVTGISSPDGGATGATLTEGTTLARQGIQQSGVFTVASGSVATFSIFFAPGTRQYVDVLNQTAAGDANSFVINNSFAPATQTQAQTAFGPGVNAGAIGPTLIGTYGGVKWYRQSVSASFAGAGAPTQYDMGFFMSNVATYAGGSGNNNAPTYLGNGSTGIIWGGDYETNAFVSTPVITGSGTALRNLDKISATFPLSSFPNGFDFIHTGFTANGIAAANQILWAISDGTTNNMLECVRNTSRQIVCTSTVSGSVTATMTLGTVADGTVQFTVALGCTASGSCFASLNSGPSVRAIGALPTGLTKIYFGTNSTPGSESFSYTLQNRFWNQYLNRTSANDNFFNRWSVG